MKKSQGVLERLSCGHGGRAALILVATHLGVVLVAVLLWLLFSLPVFDGGRWLPWAVMTVLLVVGSFGVVVVLGFWGTPKTAGRDGGEDYERTFSPRAGLALGWLRWLLQIVTIAGLVFPLIFVWGDAKPWHVFVTEASGELRERVEAMPVPDDWELTSHEREIPQSEQRREQHRLIFDVPDGYEFEDLRSWITGPEWVEGQDGEAFGKIELQYCDPADQSCRAQAVPEEDEPRFFVDTRLHDRYSGTSVEVQVTYQEPADIAAEVGEDALARFAQIPIPQDWVGFNPSTGGGNQLDISMRYGVPEDFEASDLKAWLGDTEAWAGFGELAREPCAEGDDGTWLCGDIKVDAYDQQAGTTAPDDFLHVGYDPATQVVSITLRVP